MTNTEHGAARTEAYAPTSSEWIHSKIENNAVLVLLAENAKLRAENAALVQALDAMTEYAESYILSYERTFAGYSRHDATAERMKADLIAARALLAKYQPPTA